jgi:hypothetical protein
VASLLPSWTQNPSDRKFRGVIALYHIFCHQLDKKVQRYSMTPHVLAQLKKMAFGGPGLSVSADRRFALYSQIDNMGSDIMGG